MTRDKPSKTARKREQIALQKLGEQLIGLSDAELAEMPIDDPLRDALRAAREMRSHGALRRQKQLIGKLMRGVDADALQSCLAARNADDVRAKRLFARAEAWRDRLVAEGPPALEELAAESGQSDADLKAMLVELQHTFDERREKTLRREVFRRVHSMLAATTG